MYNELGEMRNTAQRSKSLGILILHKIDQLKIISCYDFFFYK
jgi:hypothetical protein